jgi:hypothetical protein
VEVQAFPRGSLSRRKTSEHCEAAPGKGKKEPSLVGGLDHVAVAGSGKMTLQNYSYWKQLARVPAAGTDCGAAERRVRSACCNALPPGGRPSRKPN